MEPTDHELEGEESDSCTVEELRDFLAPTPADATVDIDFKNRLREELWRLLRTGAVDRKD